MSVTDEDPGAPVMPGSPLARALDEFAVTELPVGFAERIRAAAEARPAPLPDLRRPLYRPGWRMGRRIAIGLASFGALATAAAATGLLKQLAIPVPSAGAIWASLTGTAPAASSPKARAALPQAAAASDPGEIVIQGAVDTPEELGEAFRRVDQVRADRREQRRMMIDQRIRNEIARRQAAGLPVPSAEEEARLRARIEAELVRREQRADAAVLARRETLQRKIEDGGILIREDIAGRTPVDPKLRETVRQLRQLPPADRREAWRNLPPEERGTLIDEVRARRAPPAPDEGAPSPEPAG